MRAKNLSTLLALLLVPLACAGEEQDDLPDAGPEATVAEAPRTTGSGAVDALGGDERPLSDEELESGRLDDSWRSWADTDRASRRGGESAAPTETGDGGRASAPAGEATGGTTSAPDTTESWDDIGPDVFGDLTPALPLHGDVAGPSVMAVQVLLDRARFSPGIIDGRWGKNTEKALYWFQDSRGLDATGRLDETTWAELGGGDVVRRHTLTASDVEGPFVSLPSDVYERAELDCLCYESLPEKLGETFHASRDLLEQLNPGADLSALAEGDVILVPDVGTPGDLAATGDVARIVISDGGHYLHGLDASGDVLYHFPSTLGSEYAPSPEGALSVTGVHWDPTWHYQPDLLTGVPDERPDAVLPGGPNNAVGVVWMQLSKDHYGIHGTKAPETIGYATSHGCVRLTNWDARFLGERVAEGTPVEFRDVSGR